MEKQITRQKSIAQSQESENKEQCIFSITNIETTYVHPFPALW